ncbi:DEAD/DEAH box helicase [Paracoccus litorisediminis]|uniref:DEAD/DEAH box helicase n=1 Tax=Paracoccus litorisediminis TaxID=2006130 RepID=UPI003732A073
MPFRVSIGRKSPKFDRDLPTFNVTVKGPMHLFTREVENWLFIQGMNRLTGETTFETWSTRYNIGAPSLYIATYLDAKYGAIIDHDTKQMIDKAIGEHRVDDGLGSFIGGEKPLAAGDQRLRIVAGSAKFVANCSLGNHARQDLLMGAGWLPVENPSARLAEAYGTMPFTCADPLLASNLECFMVEAAREQLKKRFGEFAKNIKRSNSQEIPVNFSVAVPDRGEKIDYLPFQKGGIQMILDSAKGGIIADDMGLGKTVQAIGVLNGMPEARRILYICQANMRLKWVREIEKWKLNENLSVGHAEGSNFPDTDIVVINYDILARHIDKIRAIKWDLVFPDEAHNMKNEEAKRTQAALGTLSKSPNDADYVDMIPLAQGGILVHLTGTPKPNKIADIWPLLTSSRPDYWGRGKAARDAFMNRYCPPVLIRKMKVGRGGREYPVIIPMDGKPIREEELQMRMRGSGSFVRRMKRDTDLPPKFRTPIPLPYTLTREDQEALKKTEEEFLELQQRLGKFKGADVKIGESREAAEIIDAIIGAPPGGAEFHEIARIRSNLGVLKAPICAKFIIDELKQDDELPVEEQRKTVIFAHHKEVITILRDMIEAEYPGQVLVYDGSVGSAKKKQKIVDEFQTDPAQRVIIISRSGNTGITLTAAFRMRVVEPDWSPADMVQIEDRIWRIGQEMNVDIGYLFMPNSLDNAIGTSLMRKMETDERTTNTITRKALRGRDARDDFTGFTRPPERGAPPREDRKSHGKAKGRPAHEEAPAVTAQSSFSF